MPEAYIFQFFWGLIVLAAFIGWGGVVHRALGEGPAARTDWGLRAGWGMALMLVAGGALSLLGLVSPELLIALVLFGASLWAFTLLSNLNSFSKPSRFQIIAILCIAAPLLVRYASVVHFQAYSCSDDNVAYFPFISRLLQTGTLLDPFSIRRLAGYGGQTFLQALIGATGTEDNAFLMDRGIAVFVSFGLTIGFYRNHPGQGILPYALTLLLIFVLPFPLLNSASQTSGLALFLTLFRTLERAPTFSRITARHIWLIGIVVAAAASLRAHFLLAGALTIIIFWASCIIQGHAQWKPTTLSLIHTGAASLVCLLPWMALLHRSSNTFLYPLIRGNHRPEFKNLQADLNFSEHFDFFINTLFDIRFLLFAIPIVLFLFYRKNWAAFSLYAASLMTTATIAWVFTHSDVDNIHRYVAPFLNAAIIATMIAFTRDARAKSPLSESSKSPYQFGDKIIAITLIPLLPLMMWIDVDRMTSRWEREVLAPAKRALYSEMQSSIPKGAKILAIFNAPFALDFGRNDISTIDIPGAANPDPGMPFFKGPNAFKAYLQNLSITHIAYGGLGEPGSCLYNRKLWQHHRDGNVPVWKMESTYFLTLFSMLETLSETQQVIFKKDGFNVLRLISP